LIEYERRGTCGYYWLVLHTTDILAALLALTDGDRASDDHRVGLGRCSVASRAAVPAQHRRTVIVQVERTS
jgi:hypothetical protein